MTSTKIPYSEKIVGEIYYCISGANNHYIFEATEEDSSKSIHSNGRSPSHDRQFNRDWKNSNDRELRLATWGEKTLFLEAFGEPIPKTYQIY